MEIGDDRVLSEQSLDRECTGLEGVLSGRHMNMLVGAQIVEREVASGGDEQNEAFLGGVVDETLDVVVVGGEGPDELGLVVDHEEVAVGEDHVLVSVGLVVGLPEMVEVSVERVVVQLVAHADLGLIGDDVDAAGEY